MTLRAQVLAYALGGTLVALVVAGAGTAALLHRREVEALDATLVAAASAYARAPAGQAWVGEASSPVDVRDGDPDRGPGADAVRLEEVVFVTADGERILYFPTEAPDAHADPTHAHGLVVARAPRVRWQQSIGPFLVAYGLVVSAAAAAIAGLQATLLRAALRPLDDAGERLREVTTAAAHVRLSEEGPAEVRALIVEVNRLLDRLEAAFAAQTRFTGRAAHELRTPVALLRGELELALMRPRKPEELRETITRGLEATRRLGALVDALLALARVDAGQVEQSRERIRASELLLRVVGAELPGGEVEVDVAGDAEIDAHVALLESAVSNLVRNARVHAAPGPDRVAVERAGGLVRFVVEDRGAGAPAAMKDRFDAAHGGLGLGLPLAREVARRHGGDCRLEARPGGGCRAVLEVRG